MTSEWQPIGTAPKDGTRVLLATPFGVELAFWSTSIWIAPGAWVVSLNRSDTETADNPTHWKPVPEMPK
jgi:hypothetical protein